MTYLYTGRVAQNAVLASNALSFIFSPRAHSNFPIWVSVYIIIIIIIANNFKFRNLSIFLFFDFPRCRTPTRTMRPLSLTWRYDGIGSPV